MTDKPTKCECVVGDMNADVGVTLGISIKYFVVRCDWCKGLEVDVSEHKDTIAGLIKKVVRLEAHIANKKKYEDEYLTETDAHQEHLGKRIEKLEAQLQAANAVCEWMERKVAEHQKDCDCMLCTKVKAWRATQKGGDK